MKVKADLGIPIQRIQFRHVPTNVSQKVVQANLVPGTLLQTLMKAYDDANAPARLAQGADRLRRG
jgi:hypothetical protein